MKSGFHFAAFAILALAVFLSFGGTAFAYDVGDKVDSATIVAAFRLDAKKDLFKRADALPVSAASGLGCSTVIIILVVLVLVLLVLSTCSSRCDPRYENCSSRSSSGSYGGYSSGGGHK